MKVSVPVSLTGQKPKSTFSGTTEEIDGMDARMGTTNEPFSVKNWNFVSFWLRQSLLWRLFGEKLSF